MKDFEVIPGQDQPSARTSAPKAGDNFRLVTGPDADLSLRAWSMTQETLKRRERPARP
jgi:hypothetical protein